MSGQGGNRFDLITELQEELQFWRDSRKWSIGFLIVFVIIFAVLYYFSNKQYESQDAAGWFSLGLIITGAITFAALLGSIVSIGGVNNMENKLKKL
jgi:peptidoglycan/LPS O-acetylase OafA/YrhL